MKTFDAVLVRLKTPSRPKVINLINSYEDGMNNNSAAQTMMYDANKKSVGVTYLLWFFLGGVGGHRFYAGKTGSAILLLAITLLGVLLSAVGIGFFFLAITGIWVLIDAFLIPGWIRNKNTLLAASLSNTGSLPRM